MTRWVTPAYETEVEEYKKGKLFRKKRKTIGASLVFGVVAFVGILLRTNTVAAMGDLLPRWWTALSDVLPWHDVHPDRHKRETSRHRPPPHHRSVRK